MKFYPNWEAIKYSLKTFYCVELMHNFGLGVFSVDLNLAKLSMLFIFFKTVHTTPLYTSRHGVYI